MCSFAARGIVLQVIAVLTLTSSAWAACPTIDFEDLAVNAAVTTQYDGVTFSVQPQTCGNNPTLYMRITTPANGTSSGTKCIRIAGGCPDFSDDYLRMVFDVPQNEVSFTLGDWATTYTVRYYNTTSGAGLIGSFNVVIPPAGGGDVGVHRGVTVTSASTNIRRVEVQGATSTFEAIDDLSFDSDSTPPLAGITSPAQLACVCNGSSIIGSAHDPDGAIKSWQLHRKGLGATSWTLIRQSTTEVVNGELGPWTTTAPDGWYTLRLTITNGCDVQTVSTTDVYLNKAFNSLSLRSPTNGAIIGGGVCADGTAWDHCGGTIKVEHRPVGGANWVAFDVTNPPWITNDPLGSWNTRVGTPDGNYEVRLIGTDDCGNTASAQAAVSVDNTAPVTVITSPTSCDYLDGVVQVRGTVSDAHLAGWALYYTGGDAHGWVTIAAGNAAVNNNVLGNWNTAGLRHCAYTLRLVATDSAMLDCNTAAHNQSEHTVSVNIGGDAARFDADNDGDVDLIDFLQFEGCFGGPNLPPLCGS